MAGVIILGWVLPGCGVATTTTAMTTSTSFVSTTTTSVASTTSITAAARATTTTLAKLSVELLRVIDGDTIEVRLANGTNEKVRYIGINCPEAGDEYGSEATAYNEKLLGSGPLTIQLDVEERDKYGRLLAYVWAGDTWINERLVLDGYAQVATYPPNVKYVDAFKAAQEKARGSAAGLWGAATTTTTAPATAATEPPSTTVAPQSSDGATVYITKTGEKYHRDGCRYLKKSRIPISLGEAKAQGYGACKVCGPPS